MRKRLSQKELEEIEKILPKLVLDEHKTAKEIMLETGISEATLFRRLKKIRNKNS